jgi:hypothetical protein
MQMSLFSSSDEQKTSNLFAWSLGFMFAFILTVGLILWLLQQKKEEGITYIKIKEPATVKEPPPPEPEDFSRIEGIGPKINTVLHEAGITTYSQLSKTKVSRLQEILSEAGLSRFNPETWPEQSALATKGDWDGLASLQDKLQGGRRA